MEVPTLLLPPPGELGGNGSCWGCLGCSSWPGCGAALALQVLPMEGRSEPFPPPGIHEHRSRDTGMMSLEIDGGSYGMEIPACPTKAVPDGGWTWGCDPAPGLWDLLLVSWGSSRSNTAGVCSGGFPPRMFQGLVWGPGGFFVFFSCQWLSSRERFS